MKHFNLYLRSGVPEISEPFVSEGACIVDARNFLFSHDPSSDYVFRMWIDHNGNPCVSEYSTDDIEEYDPVFDEPVGTLWDAAAEADDIYGPKQMDDVL
jgi:hypothetical protein